jgi:hypothetical protein
MRFLKTIVKIIEAILLLMIPLAMFYWFFSSINLYYIKPFAAILGIIFEPAIALIRPYFHYQGVYNDVIINFDPFFLALVLIALFFIFSGAEKALDNLEELFEHTSNRVKRNKEKKQAELFKIKHMEEMERNKITYMVLKFKKKETKSAYLYSRNSDLFSGGLFNTMINDAIAKSKDYKGKYEKNENGENVTYNFVFSNIDDAIDYAFYINSKTKDINKEVLDQGEKLYYSVVCHCSQTEVTANSDHEMLRKMLTFGGDNEILVSELFKNTYEALKEESNLLFRSKGIYIMNNAEVEIFTLKAD